MGKYPDGFLQAVKDRVSLVDVVSSNTRLKKSGGRYKGLCPFHQEKTPSFMVDGEKGLFKCFGCGKSGDAITFVMETQRLSFPEAVEDLARRVGLAVPALEGGPAAEAKASRRRSILDANELAARFYANQFERSDAGRRAAEYLDKRKIPPELRKRFRLGAAPDGWDGLVKAFRLKKYDLAPLIEGGLAREKDGRVYDAFRGRLMFSLCDARGEVVGFAARSLGDELPKYINSPQSAVFDKSGLLYGLDHARKSAEKDRLVVVEGYMDVLMLQAVGVGNAVASMGTSLTDRHADLLRRYCKTVVLAYDADPAGTEASRRGIEMLLERGLDVRILELPEGHDPDSYARDFGGEAFRSRLDEAGDYFPFLVRKVLVRHDVKSNDGKQNIIQAVSAFIEKQQNPVRRDEQYRELAGAVGVDVGIVLSMSGAGRKRRGGKEAAADDMARGFRGIGAQERGVLTFILSDPRCAEMAFRYVTEEDFQNPVYSGLFGYIKGTAEMEGAWNPRDFFKKAHPRELDAAIGELGMDEALFDGKDLHAEMAQCLKRMRLSANRRRLAEVRERLTEAERAEDAAAVRSLMGQVAALATKRLEIEREGAALER